jgi:hypothetical protein
VNPESPRAFDVESQCYGETILEPVSLIAAAAGGCPVVVRAQAPDTAQGSPERTCPEISRLRRDFDFIVCLLLQLRS